MYAIYVNETRKTPYATAIAYGYKTIETRSKNVFKSLFINSFAQDIAIIKTGGKNPVVVGYCTMCRGDYCEREKFHDSVNDKKHLVPIGSKYDCTGAGKWLYEIVAAVPCKPFKPEITVNHGRSYCEIKI